MNEPVRPRFPRFVTVSVAVAGFALAASTPPVGAAGTSGGALAQCEATIRATPDDWNACSCYYRLAREPALQDLVVQHLEGLERRGEASPCVRFYLGSLRYAGGGDPERLYLGAAEGFEAADQLQGAFYARASLGRWLRDQGRLPEALGALDAAVALAGRLGDEGLAAQTELDRISVALAGEPDLRAVEAALIRLGERVATLDRPHLSDGVAERLAAVRFRLGELPLARRGFRELAERYRSRGETYAEASARLNAALTWLDGLPLPGRGQRAIEGLEAALEAARASGNRRVELASRRKLGEVLGRPAGQAHLEAALDLARELGDPSSLEASLLALGEALSATAEPLGLARARALLREAEGLRARAPDGGGAAEGWLNRLRILWRTESDPERAYRRSLEILAEIERPAVAAPQDLGKHDPERFAVWLPAHRWLVGRLLALAVDPSGAGAVLERLRVAPPAAAKPFPLADRIWLGRAFEVAERMRDRSLPAGAASPGAPAPFPGLDTLLRELPEARAVLLLQVAPWNNLYRRFEGGSWALVLHRDGPRLFAWPDATEIEPLIELLEGAVASSEAWDPALAAGLDQRLLAPIRSALPTGVDRLTVVADGALHRLPLSVLAVAGRDRPRAFPSFSFAPSVAAWWRLGPGRAAGTTGARPVAVVLADPAVEPASGPWSDLPALPGARREARALRRLLGDGARIWKGSDATAERLRGAAPRVLHLAAHALAEEARGLPSGVVLSDGAGGADLLDPARIRRLSLGGSLVVLSACSGAGGRVVAGEGAMSLARPFLDAGAGAVVAARWPLLDDEAARFVPVLYRELRSGASVEAAVAVARAERHGAGASAREWAGWLVLGDGSLRPYPDGLPPVVGPLIRRAGVGLAVTALLAFWVGRTPRSRRRAPS